MTQGLTMVGFRSPPVRLETLHGARCFLRRRVAAHRLVHARPLLEVCQGAPNRWNECAHAARAATLTPFVGPADGGTGMKYSFPQVSHRVTRCPMSDSVPGCRTQRER
jgi:hypothetical protein